MKAFMVLMVLGMASAVVAQEPLLVINNSGYWITHPTTDGPPVWVKVSNVVDLRTGGGGGGGGGGGTPPVEKDVIGLVKGWTQEVNHPQTAQALALVYQTASDQTLKGGIKPEEMFATIKSLTDLTFQVFQGAERWVSWRANVAALANELDRAGKLVTKEQKAEFALKVSQGLTAAVPTTAQGLNEKETADLEQMLKVRIKELASEEPSI